MSTGQTKLLTPQKPLKGNWVQTERAAHEAWARLIIASPKAAQLMHILTANLSDHNAVVISHKNLRKLMGVRSVTTVKTALKTLEADNWIEVRQIGQSGTVNAYVINDRVAWTGKRDGIRYSLFSAAVVLSEDEQPDREELGQQEPLRPLPKLYTGEQQLPTGEGLPPPSEPSLPGMEPDLPAQDIGGAPNMFPDEAQSDPALEWWGGLTNAERDAWADHVGRIIHLEDRDGKVIAATRREADIAREAYPKSRTPRAST